ncbi:1-acyl-sn-glycerol-3-phosphate acyltransferase [Marinilabiliaceae bacterium ANBcel2]|nr:1-acyl-sn-glycerol-3-phosphate acyltransferase [Marinilabiliaceae bacterium ANBcel2]
MEDQKINFESIRPYEDYEIQSVFNRLKNEESFLKLLKYLFPDTSPAQFMAKLEHITSIRQFQKDIISAYVKSVTKKTTDGVTVDGLENLNPDEPYLFISNHRDIVLDPALLNILLFDKGFNTTEIAIGDNLLIYPWITDLVKLNRTFIVKRNLPVKQMMESSSILSSYIRYTLNSKKHSIWIAQREGRAKDGNDRTQISLLKMLNISGKDNITENFKALKIVPVSISYEYDPCDYLKAAQFWHKNRDENFTKSKADDLNHMSQGLSGKKGRVHFAFGKPLINELDPVSALTVKNHKFNAVAKLIDKHIHLNYKLWPGNYIAWEILNNKSDYKNYYTKEDREIFLTYINKRVESAGCNDKEFIYNSLLSMYAYPVTNFIEQTIKACRS